MSDKPKIIHYAEGPDAPIMVFVEATYVADLLEKLIGVGWEYAVDDARELIEALQKHESRPS